jgi:hypothetical protein
VYVLKWWMWHRVLRAYFVGYCEETLAWDSALECGDMETEENIQ